MASRVFDRLFAEAFRQDYDVLVAADLLSVNFPCDSTVDLVRLARAVHAGAVPFFACVAEVERGQHERRDLQRRLEGKPRPPLTVSSTELIAFLMSKMTW